MQNILSFLLSAFFLIIISCQPEIMKKSEYDSQVDSVLYYQRVDINDPFLDTIFQNPTQKITMKKDIFPPPPPPPVKPKFKEIEGYRVQVLASTDSVNARNVMNSVAVLTTDSIYLVYDNNLYKIQVGDYPYYPEADNQKKMFRTNGYPGAWVVNRMIMIPLTADTSLTQTSDSKAVKSPQKKSTSVTGKYKIQILATQSEENAESLAASLKRDFKYDTFAEKSGTLYKVYIGYLKDEEEARLLLKKLREKGFDDAWLVSP